MDMASSAVLLLLTPESFLFSFPRNPSLKSTPPPTPSIHIKRFTTSLQTHTLSSVQHTQYFKLKHLRSRASLEGVPSELVEDAKFVPLNADDPQYGPPALLLLGFDLQETAKIQELLKNLDGEFLKIIHCTEDMISCSLWDAMHTQPNLENAKCMKFANHLGEVLVHADMRQFLKIAKSLPRICFLSGLTGEEMMMFIDAFPESGLEPAVFAALVPNSADKLLQELIDEIMGDHEMVTAKESAST